MFIHFAFGQLGKQGKIIEQTEKVISTILTEKRLVARNCTEFLPAFPVRGKPLPLKLPAKITKDDMGRPTVWFKIGDEVKNRQPNYEEITFLPSDVAMICFINISFNDLKTSPHSKEYGKFGIVLKTQFLKSVGIRPVLYYSEESLWYDPEIIAWNSAARRNEKNLKAIQDEILAFRKPETYFRRFADLTTITMRIKPDNVTVSPYKYDRYPVGYDFRKEHEHRIVFQSENDDLQFKEDDVYMLIVPTLDAKNQIISYLKNKWKQPPLIEVFPI
ncbi:hypothetical protein A3K80_05000 [Candidatus Bathyarchaeota archaeon RBG_13_38_9]|nr:MAG: hypothetical protein A3K80_05000 [Candidatus Bathyarchaeota archaeon RBG_13_38_9]